MRKGMIKRVTCLLLICSLLFALIPDMEVYAISPSTVEQNLNTLINQYANKTATSNQMYYGIQCKGFANWVFLKLFGVYIGPYPESANYKITNPQAQTVGIIEPGNLNINTAKALLQKGAPGDYIQVQRSTARGRGPHSMILTKVTDSGIEVFDCNSDGRNTIKHRAISWSKFDEENRAMSLYHANGYTAVSPPPTNHTPTGQWDQCSVEYGRLWVYGWAFDEDNYGASVDIHVYLGDARTGTLIGSTTANKERSDVGNVYPSAGSRHGYEQWFNVNVTGKQMVYVYAIDVNNSSYNTLLGCKEINFPSQPVLAPTQIRAWISDSKMGNVPETYKYGGTYYLCYELLDETTGKRYETPNGVSYQMKETIYAPDGSVANTCTYGNNNNWIAIQAGQSGRYRGVIEISGAYTGKCEVTFDIPAVSVLQMGSWLAKSPMGEETESYKQGNYCYICYELIDKESRKRWGELCAGNYNIEIIVYKPNGSVLASDTFRSDHGYFGCQVQEEGTYKCTIKISGTYINGVKEWTDTFEVLPQTEIGFYYGDLDRDGKITVTDMSVINQAANGKITLSADEKKRADLNGDGKITQDDVQLLIKYDLGEITEFPIEKMLTHIVIAQAPDKTSYYVGDALSMAGMKVEAIYGDFTIKEVTNYKISGSTSKAGTQNVTISYTEGGITKTAVQKIDVKEKHVHSYTSRVTREATCTTAGIRMYTCTCGVSYTEGIAQKQHTAVADKAQAATCTQAGKTEGSHCAVCGTVLKAQTTIPATGHVWDTGKVTKQPTATETGIRTYTCSVCKVTKTEMIPATGIQEHIHSYTEKVTKSATCSNEGEKTYTCTCGNSYTERIAPKQHTTVVDKAQAATCTTAGKTEGSHCAVCGTVLKAQTVIPMTDHCWNNGIVIKPATETRTGVKSYTCRLCGRTRQEILPIAGTQDFEGNNLNKTKVGDIVFDKARSTRYQVIRLKAGKIEVQYAGTLNGKVSSVKIPDEIETPNGTKCTVTAISQSVFQNNKYLKKVVIGNNVRTIGQKAFYGCSRLASLQLGKNVTYINANAFRKCNSLKKLVLPSSVSNIGSNAFYGCKNLKTLQVESTKLTSASLDKTSFAGISSKTSVKVPKSKLKTYRKLFRKKGIHKKIKIY